MTKNKHGLRILKNKNETFSLQRLRIFKRDKGICSYCNLQLKIQDTTLDHVIPKSKGGLDTDENLVCCCQRCNTLKDNMTKEMFIKMLKSGKRRR